MQVSDDLGAWLSFKTRFHKFICALTLQCFPMEMQNALPSKVCICLGVFKTYHPLIRRNYGLMHLYVRVTYPTIVKLARMVCKINMCFNGHPL